MAPLDLSSGPRILSLDGGGMRGLSMMLILRQLMIYVQATSQLNFTPEPWHCFDYICGISGILLGRLGKTLAKCENCFRNEGLDIFVICR